MRTRLFLLSVFSFFAFAYFSYLVAKEKFEHLDFDTTVKLQDRISSQFDLFFSYFSFLGSAEVTVGICVFLALFMFLRGNWLAIFGWGMIVPATIAELFGKLVLFHPGPPVFMHRSLISTHLPSFYVHTDFSYPSGHMTRTIFIVTILACMSILYSKGITRIIFLAGLLWVTVMMGVTRVYLGEHWLSDVLGGMMLGLGSGFLASVLILKVKKV